jgi:TIR domain
VTVAGIFINYRREDTSGYVGRLHDRLIERFGPGLVFRDLELEPGDNFEEAIVTSVSTCSVQLVLIGPRWLTVSDKAGTPRLQKPDDFVRTEIAAALGRKIRVVPVLVQDARMPQEAELPEDIRPLAKRHAIELSDVNWEHDVDRLRAVIEKELARQGVATRPAEGRGHDVSVRQPQVAAPLPQAPQGVPKPAGSGSFRRRLARIGWWLETLLLAGLHALGSAAFAGMLVNEWPNPRTILAIAGACWGLLTCLPRARLIGARHVLVHLVAAALSWTAAWTLAYHGESPEVASSQDYAATTLALQLDIGIGPLSRTLRLLMIGLVGALGSSAVLWFELRWNPKGQRELWAIASAWMLVLGLTFSIVPALAPGEDPLLLFFTALVIASAAGAWIAAVLEAYWKSGKNVLAALLAVAQSLPAEHAPAPPPDAAADERPGTADQV